eukprot:TRINITY_DN2615_c0_g1_i1.p1 TRINITY_DN2615_c0_g1~~TRINITY_DN2615_c0_g1_i1.p1  ORF type:complete len:215 (+),score=42.91 TRINITY_DN2615_c0_g1_i1:520-1164(+)
MFVFFLQSSNIQRTTAIQLFGFQFLQMCVPKKSGIVRARFYPSGFVIKPLQDLNACLVTYVLQFDLKGWVPTAVQNGITAQLPLVLCAVEQTLKGQEVVAPVLPTIDISALEEENPNASTNPASSTTGTTTYSPSSSPSNTSPSASPLLTSDGNPNLKLSTGAKGDLNEFLSQKSPRKLVSRLGKAHTSNEIESTKRDKSPKKKSPSALTESTQ